MLEHGVRRCLRVFCCLEGGFCTDGIYSTLLDCALISKWVWWYWPTFTISEEQIPLIRGTTWYKQRPHPDAQGFNNTATYVDQGGGKTERFRCRIWSHIRICCRFLEMRKNTGNEEERARDPSILWIPGSVGEWVQENGEWTLMCPTNALDYRIPWRWLWCSRREIWLRQREEDIEKVRYGMPSWLNSNRDRHSLYVLQGRSQPEIDQKNLGTIKSPNLCTEIIEYSSHEYAVCNLASGLPRFVEDDPNKWRLIRVRCIPPRVVPAVKGWAHSWIREESRMKR